VTSAAAAPPLPDQKTKGWEFTDLSGLEFESYAHADGDVAGIGEVPASLDEPVVMSLADAAERFPEIVQAHLGSLVGADDPFVARNAEAWRQGVFVYVPKGKRLEEPVQLTITQTAAGSSLNWRSLIVLEEGAEAEVWETYESGAEDLDGLFNGVTELVVGAAASLRYVCRQELSTESWVFASQRAVIDRDANLDWVALGFGSGGGKVRMETRLAGKGSSARVTGAYVGDGTQHLDYDTIQEHAAPATTSDLAFRGVLSDRATSVWRGMIKVEEGAQQTDAFQENRNLLLSKKAHADAIPGLEILADDVRCTHAAAVAQVDPEQLYYLRTRGIDERQAKRLVIEGFLEELTERLAPGPVREVLGAAMEARMAHVLS
jgi:Fe-S cluster assembly protein SufD